MISRSWKPSFFSFLLREKALCQWWLRSALFTIGAAAALGSSDPFCRSLAMPLSHRIIAVFASFSSKTWRFFAYLRELESFLCHFSGPLQTNAQYCRGTECETFGKNTVLLVQGRWGGSRIRQVSENYGCNFSADFCRNENFTFRMLFCADKEWWCR